MRRSGLIVGARVLLGTKNGATRALPRVMRIAPCPPNGLEEKTWVLQYSSSSASRGRVPEL